MDTTNEDQIPASRIMRERDEAKQAWAQEYTRANTLEASLERSQQATDDWRSIALANGEELAKAKVEAARLQIELEREKARSRGHAIRAVHLAEYIKHDLDHHGEDTTSPQVRELIEAAGVECIQCDGSGRVADEVMLGDPSDAYGYRTQSVVDECETCDGIGKVLA